MKVSYGLKGGLGPIFIRVVTVSRMRFFWVNNSPRNKRNWLPKPATSLLPQGGIIASRNVVAKDARGRIPDSFLPPAGGFLSVTSVTSVTTQCFRAFLRFSKRNKELFVALWKVAFGQCLPMLLRCYACDFSGSF